MQPACGCRAEAREAGKGSRAAKGGTSMNAYFGNDSASCFARVQKSLRRVWENFRPSLHYVRVSARSLDSAVDGALRALRAERGARASLPIPTAALKRASVRITPRACSANCLGAWE